jgi:malate/lactate dehydrogenase
VVLRAALTRRETFVYCIHHGVPGLLGAGGVEEIVELALTSDEKAEPNKSREHVKGFVDGLKI